MSDSLSFLPTQNERAAVIHDHINQGTGEGLYYCKGDDKGN